MSTTAIPIALRRTGGRIMAAGPQTLEAMYSDLDTLLRTGFSQRDEQLQNLQNAIGDVQNQINGGGQSVFGGGSCPGTWCS